MAEVKWILCKDRLPENDGQYLTVSKYEDEFYNFSDMSFVAGENGGWNCYRLPNGEICNENRINDKYAWAELDSMREELGGME